MRTSVSVLTASLLTFALAVSGNAVAGNVLLPPSNGNETSVPNIGVSPARPAAPPAAQSAPEETPQPEKKPSTFLSHVLPSLFGPATPAPTQPIEPPPTVPTVAKPQLPKPQVVRMPEMPPQAQQTMEKINAAQPHHLGLDLGEKFALGTTDILMLRQGLGMPEAQIRRSCSLSMMGLVVTEKGHYPTLSDSPRHLDIGYDGMLKSVQVIMSALCPRPQQLPNGAALVQVGDLYSLPLGAVTCTPQANSASISRLAVTYLGDRKADCAFR